MEPDAAEKNSTNSLLDRTPTPELIEEWTAHLASPKDRSEVDEPLALIVFRCTQQWFALAAQMFERICTSRPIRAVPFRTNDTFRGLVNIDGELSLCVSLPAILGFPEMTDCRRRSSPRRRLCLISYRRERVAFEVDELLGYRKIPRNSFISAPANSIVTPATHTDSFCTLEGKLIGLLDTNKFSASIRRALSW